MIHSIINPLIQVHDMSASTEELLQQIYELEARIQEAIALGKNTRSLQDKLVLLKEQFEMMNENLNRSEKVLKG